MDQRKKIIVCCILACLSFFTVAAQQKLDSRGMNYLPGVKPNNIIYRDTLYTGAKQFKDLFYRTGDAELVGYYEKHQSNKIAGQAVSFAGTIATIIGLSMVTSGDNKGTGWVVLGGGFVTALTGGYLTFKGQQNMLNAVILFNHKYSQAAIGIGAGNRQAGLVMKF